MNGNSGVDFVNDNSGNDTVHGGKDDDVVRGGQGDDYVYGDLGNDIIYGDLGNDVIFGGEGNDVIVYRSGDGYDNIEDAGPGHDVLRCEGVRIQNQHQDGNDLIFEMSDGGLIRIKNHLETTEGC